MSLAGIVVDLDDTLYPQFDYLEGAARATAMRASAALGLDEMRFRQSFLAVLAEGSDRGRTIDRALERVGCEPSTELVDELREAFASFFPERLVGYAGATEALVELRELGPLALLSDGDPRIQRAKLAALGITEAFDLLVITDERFGREHRKPDPAGLNFIADAFSTVPSALVMIGDRVDKDVAVAERVGARPIRVRTGEHADAPTPSGVTEAASFVDAARLLRLAAEH